MVPGMKALSSTLQISVRTLTLNVGLLELAVLGTNPRRPGCRIYL